MDRCERVVVCVRLPACSAFVIRCYSAEKPHGAGKKMIPIEPELPIEEVVKNWENANKIYYGPQRDFTNFPRLVNPLTNPPVRLGFIPESFFQLFSEKTGVTGEISCCFCAKHSTFCSWMLILIVSHFWKIIFNLVTQQVLCSSILVNFLNTKLCK